MRILLILNKDKKDSTKVINLFKKNFKKIKIINHLNFNNNLRNNYDYVISYLSKKILKTKIFI